MTVKETYCLVRNLAPNTQYEFWVTAQNRAGCSPASERAVYMTGEEAMPWAWARALSSLSLEAHSFARVAGWDVHNTTVSDAATCVLIMGWGSLFPHSGPHTSTSTWL